MNQSLTQQRLRIRFAKSGPMRFVGHLDLAKTWERILRRAEISLEYSQGFNPRPRMQFAAALPVGVTSECEYLDIWLTERCTESLIEWKDRLQHVSPTGITIISLNDVEIKSPSLPVLVTHASYEFTLIDPAIRPADIVSRVDALLAQDTIERQGHKKSYDLRPLILSLTLTDEMTLTADLVTGDRGNARPDELLDALGYTLDQARIHRHMLHLATG